MLVLTRIVPWLGAFVLTCLTAAGFVKDPRAVPQGILTALYNFSQAYRPALMVGTALCVLFGQLVSIPLERSIRNRKLIRTIVDKAREECLRGIRDDLKHKHRLTLFRCQRLWQRLLTGRYLSVYVRSGTHARSRTVFRVDEQLDRCEGIAGLIWYIDATIPRTELPPWPDDPADQVGQQQHAAAGRLTVEKARRLKVRSRVLMGAIVRVGGEKWGVLLLDSVVTTSLEADVKQVLRHCASLLSRVI